MLFFKAIFWTKSFHLQDVDKVGNGTDFGCTNAT